MAEKHYLAFDLGAESGRAVLGRFDGKTIQLEEVHRFANGPVNLLGSLHWDALRLFDEMKNGLRKASHQYGADLAGLGVDTWGVDFGLIGRGDVLLGNPYNYRDPRTDGILDKVFEVVPRATVFDRTGIQFLPFNTIYQLYSMVLAKHPLLDVAETLLLMPDLFHFFFTGVKVSEFSDVTTTQLYDPRLKSWSRELFEKLQMPLGIMPEIVKPGSVIGKILPQIREETGAGPVSVIAPAAHDTGSAVAAVPARGSNWAYISSGTWSLLGAEVPEPIINDTALAHNFTNEGGVEETFRFLKNIMGLWIVQECRREWARQGNELDYPTLTRMAADAPAFQAFIQPDDIRFLGVGNMPQRVTDFLKETGQPVPDSEGGLVRVILESLAFRYRETLEGLVECLGHPVETLHIVGGGTQNKLLNQFAANALGFPVVTGPIEATAIGNVAVQAIANGDIRDLAEARGIIAASFPTETYEPRDVEAWETAYGKYKEIGAKAREM